VLVENVSLAVDTRLRKQVSDLLRAGYRVSVVTRTDPDNGRYRTTPGLTVLEYPVPADRAGVAGYVLEYLVSFFWAAVLSLRLRLRGRIDVLQVCQPPDVYFPLCWLLRWLGARIVVDQRDLMPEVFAARYDRPRPAMMAALRWLERRSQRVADETLCVNEYLRDRLVAAGAAPERVSVIRNGPVLERVECAVPDGRAPIPHMLDREDGPAGPGGPRDPRRRMPGARPRPHGLRLCRARRRGVPGRVALADRRARPAAVGAFSRLAA
jgi:hypothetical protein